MPPHHAVRENLFSTLTRSLIFASRSNPGIAGFMHSRLPTALTSARVLACSPTRRPTEALGVVRLVLGSIRSGGGASDEVIEARSLFWQGILFSIAGGAEGLDPSPVASIQDTPLVNMAKAAGHGDRFPRR